MEACACGTLRASASSMAKLNSAVVTVLPPGVFITTTPCCVAGFHVHVVHAHAGAADDAQCSARLR